MATFPVEVVSAERQIFSGTAKAVFARSLDGEIGILPGHQPVLLALDIAPVKIVLEDDTIDHLAVHNGFLYYQPGDKLIVLADIAELASQIDVDRAREHKADLERRADEMEDAYVEASVHKAEVRMRVADMR